MIDKFLMVGGGVLERREGRYFVKAALADYLQEMTQYFQSVAFMALLSSAVHNYRTSLEEIGVTAYPWNIRPGSLLRSAHSLWRTLDRKTGVWLQLPQTPLLPLMPILKGRSAMLLTYLACDWVELARELRGRGKGWRLPLDNSAVRHPLGWADQVLVRGPKLLSQARKFNPHVVESLPIISTRQGHTLREDSCQGESISILYVGKLLLAKGVGVLLQAVSQLSEHTDLGNRIRLRVVGDGEDRQQVERLVLTEGLQDKTEFWGFCDDPRRLGQAFREADLLIIPSIDSEGMPRVLEEGLRHSLPVVATRVGGIPIAYQDGRDLVLVEPGSSQNLTKAMARVIRDDNLRRSLIARAQRRAAVMRDGRTAARQHARLILETELSQIATKQP